MSRGAGCAIQCYYQSNSRGKNLKIIVTNSSPIYGGNENWAVTTSKLLKERGHSVKMLVRNGSEVHGRSERLGLENIAVPHFGGDFDPIALVMFFKIFKDEKPDAVILSKTKDYWICGIGAMAAGVPVRCLRLSIVRRVQDNLKYKLVYRKIVNRVIVNSKEVEQGIRDSADWLMDIPIHVLYNGLEKPDMTDEWLAEQRKKASELRRKFKIPNDAFVFGACVNITFRKRLDLVISALAELKDKLPNAHYFIAGKGNCEDELKDLAKRLNVADRVHFAGYFYDVTPLYCLFDLYVIASRQESMTYVGMQSLMHGCPVLSTDCGGIRELLNDGECGMIVPVDDQEAIREGMHKLATDKALREDYANKGRKRFKECFASDRMIDELEGILS